MNERRLARLGVRVLPLAGIRTELSVDVLPCRSGVGDRTFDETRSDLASPRRIPDADEFGVSLTSLIFPHCSRLQPNLQREHDGETRCAHDDAASTTFGRPCKVVLESGQQVTHRRMASFGAFRQPPLEERAKLPRHVDVASRWARPRPGSGRARELLHARPGSGVRAQSVERFPQSDAKGILVRLRAAENTSPLFGCNVGWSSEDPIRCGQPFFLRGSFPRGRILGSGLYR